MSDFEADDVLRAISGTCDNGLPIDDDGHRLDVAGFVFGHGLFEIVDENDEITQRFSVTVVELDDENEDDSDAEAVPGE